MSEMQVSMRLSLQNLASGPLAEFADQIKGIEPIIASLNAKFATFGRSLRGMNDSAASGASGMARFERALGGISDKLAALETKLGASVDGFAQFGVNAREAAAGVTEASAAIGVATTRMDAAAVSARAAKTEMFGFGTALKGMAEIWAGLKIEHGLKNSVRAASDFATQVAQLRSLGLSGDQVKYAQQQAWRSSSQVPYVSAAEALASRRAIIAGTGQNNEALMNAALPELLRNAYAYKNLLGSKASISDIIGNFAGLAEARGMSQSASGLAAASDQALQVALATQGRMKLSQQEVVARQYKYGGAQLVDAPGYARIMALAEQYTLAGHEGGGGGGGRGVSQVGTALGMVLKTMLGGKMNKVTEEMLTQMGMFEPGVKSGSTTTTSTNTFGILRGSTLGEKDPLKWVHDVLVPRMLAYAIKNASTYFPHGGEHNADAQKLALDRVAVQMFGPTGGVNVSNMVAMASNPAVYSRLENTVGLASQAKTGSSAVAETNQYTKALAQFSASVENLKVAIGSGLLPLLTPVIDFFGGIARAVGSVAHALPGLSEAVGVAGAAFATFLTVAGFSKIIGLSKQVVTSLLGIGTASETAAGESEAAGSVMESAWALRLKGILGIVGTFVKVITIAFLLIEAGNSIKVAGVTINNHVEVWINELYGQFDRFFTWLNTSSDRVASSMFGAISRAASAVGATGVASWAKGHQITLAAEAHQFQMNYEGRRLGRNLRIQTELSPQGQPGYMRPANGAPDTEKMIQDAQNAIANQLSGSMGGLPKLGAHKGRHAKHILTPQQLADSWALQDLHRAGREANHQNTQWQHQVRHAQTLVQRATEKSKPGEQYYQAASVLAAAGNHTLAAQAMALGDKASTQANLKGAKSTLSGLQSDLANQTKLNAAQVTAGVLTPDQAQAKTLADQKAAAPQLLAAAEAVKRYEQALGQSTTAIDATITKIKDLGNGLTQMQQKISNTAQGAFEGFFSAFMSGRKTWKQMGDQFVTSLLTGINSAVSQNLAQGLIQGLLGSSSGAGQALRGFGGSGGQMSAVGSWIGNLFSSSASGAASSSIASSATGSGGWIDAIAGWLANMGSSFAAGADTVPHDMVAQIHKGEMIVPASGAEAIRSGALGGSKQVHLTVHAMDSQSVMQALHGVAREASSLFGATNQNLNLGY